ncbi:MAG TPA: rod shape-determining protein MreD [Ruminiclostridium sp.]
MRSRIMLYSILIFTFVTTQVTLLNFISIFGVAPNLVIILIVSVSLLEGSVYGSTVGFFIGLCLDAVIGIALGYHALIGMLLGWSLGNINKRLFKENIFVMAICTFISTILFESAIIFASYLYRFEIDFFLTLKNIILPEALINSVLGMGVFWVIIQINRKLISSEGKNRY